MNNEFFFVVCRWSFVVSRWSGYNPDAKDKGRALTLKVQIHEDVGVDDGEGRTNKDTEQIITGEAVVLALGVG